MEASNECEWAFRGCRSSSLHPNQSAESHTTTDTESQPILPFPKTLMEMMEYCDEMNSHTEGSVKFCVTWLPGGKSFLVRDPTEFARTIIPKFFKPSKFTSFARKLYRWGFRQFTSLDTDGTTPPLDAVAFSAPFFSRDAKHLLRKMKSGGRRSEKKPKMTDKRAETSTSKNINENNSNTCNSNKKRTSFDSVTIHHPLENEISDISSESSQGPLKKRKIGISAESPITLDGCDEEYNEVKSKMAVNPKKSNYFFVRSNNIMDHANNGDPTQVGSRQNHQQTSEAVSNQAQCRENDALFQLLLANIVATRNQTQTQQSLPQHPKVSNNFFHSVPCVPSSYRQSLQGIAGFLQGVRTQTSPPNMSVTYPPSTSASHADSQSALLRHLESMMTPQPQNQTTSHAMTGANRDNEISSAMAVMKNLIAKYNTRIEQQQQSQVISTINDVMLNMQQKHRQQENCVDAAISQLAQPMYGNFH
ncbi:hypothetical protein ACHAXS_001294 [Conticribra weissflogii]